ncbi:MAG TPA: helicase C-terminal domain-containing protein, partial [bacterium]|nr:helicase C-terminal domain-containing protein [bacterium]
TSQEISCFFWFSLPLALIQLRQGIGRLIRSESDEGVVILLSHPLKPSYRQRVYETFPVPPVSGLRWTGVMDLIRRRFPEKEYD